MNDDASKNPLEDNRRTLTTLSAISRAISFSRTPEDLCDALAFELHRVLPVDAFYMEAYRPRSRTGLSLGDFDTLDGVFQRVPSVPSAIDREQGALRSVYQEKQPLIINRSPDAMTRDTSRFIPFGNVSRPSATLAFLPLIVGERVIGVMSAQSYAPNAFGADEVDLLLSIARSVAPAVEGVVLSHQLLTSSETLRSIVAGTSTTTGEDFFRSLVRHLASAFGVRSALLGEVVGSRRDRVRTRAVWTGNRYRENFEFSLKGTPYSDLRNKGIRYVPREARERYPNDPVLAEWKAESFMGIPLLDASGKTLGILEVLDTHPLDEDLDLESVLRVFAARTGAELERIRAEEAVKTSEEKYRNLFENALVGMFRRRLSDGLVIEANQRIIDLMGYDRREDFVGKVVFADVYVDPGTRDRMVRLIQEKGEVSNLEARVRRKDGTILWIQYSAKLDREQGYIEGVVTDISEKKRLETERETFAWLSLQLVEADTLGAMAEALTHALDLLFQFDSMYFAHRLPGADRFQAVLAMDMIDGRRRIYPATGDPLDAYRPLGRLLEGEPFLLNRQTADECPLPRSGDTTRQSESLLFAPVVFGSEVCGILSVQSYERNRYGEPDLRLLKAAADMVAPALRRAQAETQLRRSEARNRALLDAIPDLIFVIGRDGTFKDYKATREQLFLPPEEFLGKRAQDVLPRELAEKTLRHARRALKTGAVESFEYQLPLGSRLGDYETRMVPCGTDELLVIVRDITDRKHLEEQLRQAQKMEAIGRLAGGVAHDFNNLLTGILGNLHLAQADASAEVRPLVEEALKAGERASRLVSQLLAFGRKARVTVQATDVAGILREVAGIARNAVDRRIEILVRIPRDLRRVLGDAGQIHLVLLNLFINARDALQPRQSTDEPADLRITLEAEDVDLGEDDCSDYPSMRPGPYVVLTVADTGVGMDEETQKHLFEPFFTTKEVGKGTGLGLATIYGIVQQHNGWITVHSEPGRGSTFKVYLPAVAHDSVADLDDEEEDKAPEILPAPGGAETILLVDDEAFLRRLGRRILEPIGYTVLDAADGEEALEVFRQHQDTIALVLLDLSMPKLSGQETLARLRTVSPGLKVILSSGYARMEDFSQQVGAADYISKPYRPAELARTVRKVLDA